MLLKVKSAHSKARVTETKASSSLNDETYIELLQNQCDFSNRTTWKRVNQLLRYLRTKDGDRFLKETNRIEEYEQRILKKGEVLRTSQETVPFLDWLVSILNFVRFSTVWFSSRKK